MSFLPIVERELRAACRRRSTFRVRWWTTLAAMTITCAALAAISIFGRARGPGNPLFEILTGYAFVLCLLSGVLMTADALARERREGTLGLLFLTNLKGYDIVLGKFAAHSVSAFYALLALLPATALPMLVGGVEGSEFFRKALALLNALFVSLAVGIAASAFSRESRNAVGNGVGLMLMLVVVLPLLAVGLRAVAAARGWQAIAWFSPAFSYAYSAQAWYVGQEKMFWTSLGLAHLLGWLLLAAASLVLTRAFQDKPLRTQNRYSSTTARLRRRPRKRNASLLFLDPIGWLRGAELGIPWLAWILVLAWGLAMSLSFLFLGWWEVSGWLIESARPFGFLLKVFFAFEACRFFVDARQNGTLELLLCTPLSNRDIINGQMKALLRAYGPPIVVLVLLVYFPVLLKIGSGLLQPSLGLIESALGAGFLAGVFTVRMALDSFAILWLGTALALTSPRPNTAPTWTILFVLILPAPLSTCWMDILIDVVLISWSTNRCRLDLRRLVAEQFQASVAPSPGAVSRLPTPASTLRGTISRR